MKENEPRPRLEELGEAECFEILGRHLLGRIAIVIDGQPLILPVNYAIDRGVIAFRTGSGTILAHAPNSRVCFEVDGYDAASGVGWSVVVEGVARDATDDFDDVSWVARGTAPLPLAPGAKPFWIGIEAVRITGRRFGGSA
jgi:hypothetical protein